MSVYAGYLEQLDLMKMPKENRPAVRWLVDPTDYLKPIVFSTGEAACKDGRKEAMLDSLCKQPGAEVHLN
jgi:hypothetical protein